MRRLTTKRQRFADVQNVGDGGRKQADFPVGVFGMNLYRDGGRVPDGSSGGNRHPKKELLTSRTAGVKEDERRPQEGPTGRQG